MKFNLFIFIFCFTLCGCFQPTKPGAKCERDVEESFKMLTVADTVMGKFLTEITYLKGNPELVEGAKAQAVIKKGEAIKHPEIIKSAAEVQKASDDFTAEMNRQRVSYNERYCSGYKMFLQQIADITAQVSPGGHSSKCAKPSYLEDISARAKSFEEKYAEHFAATCLEK